MKAHREGLLPAKAEQALAVLRSCRLCPRACEANRAEGKKGVCRCGGRALFSTAFAHLGEEDCLRGWNGSGTIFFAQCNLRCVFCQNFETSQLGEGKEITPEQLAAVMLRLQEAGCHNINFVTPSHVVPQILEALPRAIAGGLCLPLVYNTSGYDSVETIRLLDGVVDIYMPDFKLWDPDVSAQYLTARDYPAAARQAIQAMHAQVGDLIVDEDGLALRGLLVRHLVMPTLLEDTRRIMRFLADQVSRDTFVNLMDQYHPAWKAVHDPRYHAINRGLESEEFSQAVRWAREAGLWRFDQRRATFGVL